MNRNAKLAGALAATTLLLAACANDPEPSSTAPGDQIELTMTAAADFRPAVEDLVADFEAANPGVTISVTFGGGNDFETSVGTAIQSGNAPDIIDSLPGSSGPIASQTLIQEGIVMDLSDQEWASRVPPAINADNNVDHPDDTNVYFNPVLVQPMGAFYNSGLLDQLGLEAPDTWSGVLEFCAAAREGGKIPYSLGIADQWITQLVPYSLANTLIYGDDPSWGRGGDLLDGTVTFPTSGWLETFEKYDEMRQNGCFSDDPNALNLDASMAEMATEKAIGIVQVGGLFGNLSSLNEDIAYELKPLPATDDADDTIFPASPAHMFGVSSTTDHPEEAKAFLAFLAAPENLNKFVLTTGGSVPAVPNDEFEAPELLQTFNEFVAAERTRSFPHTGNAEVAQALMVGTQNMFLGTATPLQVVEGMQAAIR